MTSPTLSLQSQRPLQRVGANSGQEPVGQIAFHPMLLIDPPYQRGAVWGPARRRNLVRSLMLGVPVGNIFWNHRPDMTMAVIDGRQRIETIQMFVNGQLDVPRSWFEDADVVSSHETADGSYVRYDSLTDRGRGKFDRCSMTTQLTQLATVEEEAELFNLVNFGGLPQGHADA